MKLLSSSLVKQSLAAHSWLGILVGALMYWICLSGSLAVFAPEWERWEQPAVDEFSNATPAAMDRAYKAALARETQDTHHMFMLLPTEEKPRARISTDHQGWYADEQGTLKEPVASGWTELLVNLHLYIHLPTSFGMVMVSLLGALLCGLIVSGFLAHPSIFKHAFSFRTGGSRRLEQTDLHNRLSVWGAPFHLIIAVTGAFFGLAALMSGLFADALFDGDQDRVVASLYGAEPELQQPVEPAAIGTTLRNFEAVAPGVEPFYVTVEDVGTPEQYTIVGGRHPDRLIYAEQYRFDTQGNYVNKVGFSDASAGRQTIFSIYRIHFGHFDGSAVKVLYLILGLALTAVSATGVGIWLAKRKGRDYLNNAWSAIIWGTPAALALSAVTQVILGWPSTAVLWTALAGSVALAQWLDNDNRSKGVLLLLTAAALLLLVLAHLLKFGAAAWSPAALGVNASLGAAALALAAWGWRGLARRHPATPEAVVTPDG